MIKNSIEVKYLYPIIRETKWYKSMIEEMKNEKRN